MAIKTIGVIGGGQLTLMMGEAIRNARLPFNLIATDPSEHCPARPYLIEHIKADFKDEEAIRKLALKSDVLTYEVEFTNADALSLCEYDDNIRPGFRVHPNPIVLNILQDKHTQAKFLRNKAIPVPEFRKIDDERDLHTAAKKLGLPLMLKARKDSYDGNGNYTLRGNSKRDVARAFARFANQPFMAQEYVTFDKEISVIGTRGFDGDIKLYVPGENIHGRYYNILQTTIAPARISPELAKKATDVATIVLASLCGVGTFGIEMLVSKDEVSINEIAPRVHNTGHYTIEGCVTSQFEQHLKAITGMPLKDTTLRAPTVMHNLNSAVDQCGAGTITYRGTEVDGTEEVSENVFVHNYRKSGLGSIGTRRKMGHVTIVGRTGETQDQVLSRSYKILTHIKVGDRKAE